MRQLFVFLVITSVLLLLGQVYAQSTFSARVQSRFVLPCTGSSSYNPDLVNACQLDPTTQLSTYLAGGVSIAWGTGSISPTLRSNLTFTSFPTVTLGLGLPNAKAIGKLTHQNYPINCYSSCSTFIPTYFKLALYVSVALTGGSTYSPFEGVFSMFLDETPNQDPRNNVLTDACTIPNLSNEISWKNAGGYTNDFPCCPYYTDKQSPPDPISRGGPCSDRITFITLTAPDTFSLGGTVYTLAIAGFSSSATTFNNDVSFFTSQENQFQEAYVYAYVLRQCASSAACNDSKQCTDDVCSSGLCRNNFKASGTSCTDPATSPFYDSTSQCLTWQCNGNGQCLASTINEGGACNPSTPRPTGSTSDCARSVCVSGVCSWQNAQENSVCTSATLTEPQCQAKKCQSGACKAVSANSGAACTFPTGTPQRTAMDADSTCNKASCSNGVCVFSPQNSGSCTSQTATVCNKRQCKQVTTSGFTKGSCTLLYDSNQGSCATGGLAVKECNGRRCQSLASGKGSCQYVAANGGGSCTVVGAVVQCNRRLCSAGSCVYTANTAEVPASCPGVTLAECRKFGCQSFTGRNPPGSCATVASSGGSCTGTVAAPECKVRQCNNGACKYSSGPNGGSCTGMVTKECNTRKCNNGACKYSVFSGGSCTGAAVKECNVRACKSGACGYTAANAGGSCAGIVAKECNARVCNSGACSYTAINAGGSCTGVVAKECNARACTSGACSYTAINNGGSCTGAAVKECNVRLCSAGACAYTATNSGGSCTSVGQAKQCNLRLCTAGACTYTATNAGGSCTTLTASQCNARTCTNGACTYSFLSWTSDGTGSCASGLALKECNRRSCFQKRGSTTSPVNPIGSCGYNLVTGSCTGLTLTDCRVRQCALVTGAKRGTCQYQNVNVGGSCTSISSSTCNQRLCKVSSGLASCVLRYQNQGSAACGLGSQVCNSRGCLQKTGSLGSCGYTALSGSCSNGVIPAVQDCRTRTCVTKTGAAFPGSCRYQPASEGAVCTANLGPINSCTRQICSSGNCVKAVKPNRPTCTPGFSTNDAGCIPSRCVSAAAGGGTCSTSFRTGGSCTALTARSCSARRCTSGGTCAYSYASYPANTPCNDASAGPTGSFCAPQFCDGAGVCSNNRLLRQGSACISRADEPTATCTTSACLAGVCKDTSDVATNNNSLICKANGQNEDSCQRYYCVYRSSSPFDKLGTCRRQINPATVNAQCTIIGNTDSERDQRCYSMICESGACSKVFKLDGSFCDTPPNTPTLNGYGCSQYVCKSGKCDTSKTVAVANGSACAGVVPCDPAQPSCLTECERFTCLNGRCSVNYHNEGNNCTYIKYLTARDGSLVSSLEDRADSSDPRVSDECTLGRCFQGRCAASLVKNGTACGNRTKNQDLCYGDYCNEQGRCIVTDRRNCQGVVPLPSVCWDVTCDAKDGSCVLVSSGVIDCSCIDDCSACTAIFSLTNSTSHRTLGCYWCTPGSDSQLFSSAASTGTPQPSCFNRFLPGNLTEIPAPSGWTCHTDESVCGGGDNLTGGAVAGIVLGILGLTSFALLAIAVAILLFRYFAAASVPPANASLTDLAFDNNVKNNVFYEGANLDQISALYSDPHFITN